MCLDPWNRVEIKQKAPGQDDNEHLKDVNGSPLCNFLVEAPSAPQAKLLRKSMLATYVSCISHNFIFFFFLCDQLHN